MVNLTHDRCCGCGACAAICPKMAISMQESYCGFIYPVIDNSKCVNCNLCDKVCPELSAIKLSSPKVVYAACNKDRQELSTCASGGAATAFCRSILHCDGVVYGCSQSNYHTIRHIRIDCEGDLDLLKGSKYVQSNMGTIYTDVKSDLLSGRKVLFIGTPCQVGALYGFLQKKYQNLYTVDLVCHGVPSQAMLRSAVESETGPSDDLFVNFRWKTQYGIQFGIQFGNRESILKSVPAMQSAYMTAFLKGLSYRENCHNCKYSQSMRVGDITIGDFWGLGKDSLSEIDPKDGASLIMVNTDCGADLWKNTEDFFIAEIRDFEEAVKYNWNLHDPSPRPANKDKFLKIYTQQGMEQAARSCVQRYRIESMGVVRLIRQIPLLNKTLGLGMRVVRRII